MTNSITQSKIYLIFHYSVAKGYPDMRTCLLHQKLQILNVCIDRKILQHEQLSAMGGQVLNEKNDSEDEFYDCDEDEQQTVDEGDESKCPIIFYCFVAIYVTVRCCFQNRFSASITVDSRWTLTKTWEYDVD